VFVNRRKFCYSLVALPNALSAASLMAREPLPSPEPSRWDGQNKVRFVLEDLLDHPFYWWPRTLLTYPVQFDRAVNLKELALTRVDTGQHVPIQFSDVVQDGDRVRSATLNFFSDLPSGGRREFELAPAGAAVVQTPEVTEHEDHESIVLDSGVLRVRIPKSREGKDDVPGPILQVSRGGPWIGSSNLKIEGQKVLRIATRRLEAGPLLIAYEIAYDITGGSRYVARIQLHAGEEFVRFAENMEGMQPGVRGVFACEWSGFAVTHRQSPNHPYPVIPKRVPYVDYAWEKVDDPFFFVLDTEHLPKGQLPFSLGIYGTWTAFHSVTSANFWDERSGDALGVFIDKPDQWQDHEYANHTESETTQVRYLYRDGKFSWEWPITRGSRSMCVAFYDHAKDLAAMKEMDEAEDHPYTDGETYKVVRAFTSHTMFLQNRHNTIDLNRVKDWTLEYPASSRQPPVIFTMGTYQDPGQLERDIMTSQYIGCLPLLGTRENGGLGSSGIVNFSPVPSRRIQSNWVDGFNRLSSKMTERQRRRMTAMYLFVAYVHAGDDFMPLVPMLSGHPNFLADVKATPGAMAFLFPDHPMAQTWADLWEKAVETNTRYNTRPAVQTWNASGGRWTENLGTYVWAFLRPSLRTAYLLKKFDGGERFLSPQLAEVAQWLVGSLTAPFDGETEDGYRNAAKIDGGHEWGVLEPGQGPRREHPPQGAHAERRVPPRSLWYLGTLLRNYRPLSAEHAMWAARPTYQDSEEPPNRKESWDVMYEGITDNTGTNPHLRSTKFTGYGIVLRSAVDTPDEVSIHLQQIDQGPNYRWGRSSDGGCGVLYYSAKGKSYSFNGPEEVGDRFNQDTDFCTNFGVFKNGSFRSIGMNVLSRPMYDLGVGNFAELVSRHDGTLYSAPEYVSRSVMLAGHDYFLVYDRVYSQDIAHRLSWFVRRGDELPTIKLVRGGNGDPRATQSTEIKTLATTGMWFDGTGDSLALVTHRKDISVQAKPFGCVVHAAGVEDVVFFNPTPVSYEAERYVFTGTAGLIRKKGAATEFALFHGSRIGVEGLIFTTDEPDLGISGTIASGQSARGVYYAPHAATVKVSAASIASKMLFCVDGRPGKDQTEAGAMVVDLEAGLHHWELTEGLPVPMAPRILRTENVSGGAQVLVDAVASAERYRLELSRDAGATWATVTTQVEPRFKLSGLANEQKVHVRAIAINAAHESSPGLEYPLYVTGRAPDAPDGLRVALTTGVATLTWGEVLGVSEYRLYARPAGATEFHLLYRGLEPTFVHKQQGIQACGSVPRSSPPPQRSNFIEYYVAAVNGNGEGAKSRKVDTDPGSWRNWDPMPGEPFRRVEGFAPDTPASSSPWARYYPA
jgi:hypothetical protein